MRGWGRCGVALAFVWAALVTSGCAVVRRAGAPPLVRGTQVGVASWYGPGFHGRRTASGERYDQRAFTAAHNSLPLGTRARVTNLDNGLAVDVRINDRGPFVDRRVIDLSYAAAREIDMVRPGTATVRVEVLEEPPGRYETGPDGLPGAAYAVQVAAMGDADGAERLRRTLAGRFPEAFVVPAGSYYRVRMGPYSARGVAAARADQLQRLGYTAIVVEQPL